MVELAEMIKQLRDELTTAMTQSAGARLRFELGPVEIEASFVVRRGTGGDARLRFLVLDAGANGSVSREETQRITLTLQPRLASSSAPPMISGTRAAGER
ncbi:hypothetical protein OG216_33300 [Streptomycetaceae bacterium NBC_01309]